MKFSPWALVVAGALPAFADDERVNHAGRLLGPLPVVTAPLLFNSPEADAVVAAMQILPVGNPWNEDISQRPLLANSAAMMTQISADLAANRQTLRPFYEMNYVLVPDAQPAVPITFFNYPDESDLDGGTDPVGLYPIPTNLPVETWPRGTGGLSLSQWQEDVNNTGGDRHSIIVKPGAGLLWETWLTRRVGSAWEASNGAKFNLASNALRPATWTSGDAAGLPMFPALVRYDECQRGVIEHALRLIVKRTRRDFIYPATHYASSTPVPEVNVPAMGQRLRLKASFTIPATWTVQEKAVLTAFKKYGALVADNGGFFSISVAPDDRFPAGCFDRLSTVNLSNFEVIQTTGLTEGPRSPGAPTASAGPDQTIPAGTTASLGGSVVGSGTIAWKTLAGPGSVTFVNASAPGTTATFTQPGHYILALSIADGVHAVTYDPVAIEVVDSTAAIPFRATITRDGPDALLHFPTVAGRLYRVQYSADLGTPWLILADNLPGTGAPFEFRDPSALNLSRRFYRVALLP